MVPNFLLAEQILTNHLIQKLIQAGNQPYEVLNIIQILPGSRRNMENALPSVHVMYEKPRKYPYSSVQFLEK
jgi:hypothetical protein